MSTRKFSRVHFSVQATVRNAERQFQGEVENLSMAGMFLVTNERLTEGEAVAIKIFLSGTLPEIAVGFTGTVTRIDGNGAGITFEKMDLDSYTHLKNIIAYNLEDAETVMDEIGHSIDEKIAADK